MSSVLVGMKEYLFSVNHHQLDGHRDLPGHALPREKAGDSVCKVDGRVIAQAEVASHEPATG